MKIRQLNDQKGRFCCAQIIGVIVFALFFMISCASTKPEIDKQEMAGAGAQDIVYPEYTGPKTPLAVLPMGLSERAAKRYPHLLESEVGLGIHNVLTDALYRTGRFRFVEDKESVMKEMMERWRLSSMGVVDQDYAIQLGRMLGAKKVVYGEVYDYAEGKQETITGLNKSTMPRIRVGVQVRMVDLETLEYIPASTVKYGADWGEASQAAIESAVLIMINRLE